MSIEQIRELEQKIQLLREQITQLMKKQKELEDPEEPDQLFALQQSDFVQMDETLDWKLSAVDIVNSRIFTPICNKGSRNRQS